MASCPRCGGEVSPTAAICPHCNTYLLEWDRATGRLGPTPGPEDEIAGRPDPPGAPADPSDVGATRERSADRGARPIRGPIFGQHPPPARPLSVFATLTVLRLLVAVSMAVHGALLLMQLASDPLLLLGWVAIWLPLDAYWRSHPLRRRL